jgi:hypothetical protein
MNGRDLTPVPLTFEKLQDSGSTTLGFCLQAAAPLQDLNHACMVPLVDGLHGFRAL